MIALRLWEKFQPLLKKEGLVETFEKIDLPLVSVLARMARFAMQFCAHESCGKCTPCRIGSTRGAELIDRIMRGIWKYSGQAFVNDEIVAEAELLCTLKVIK